MDTRHTPVSPDLKWSHEQALASARVEGFEPSAEFLSDCDELQAGRISFEELQTRTARRAALEQAAADKNG